MLEPTYEKCWTAAGLTLEAAQKLVTAVLLSVHGSEPDLDAPLVQAGLDSLGAADA